MMMHWTFLVFFALPAFIAAIPSAVTNFTAESQTPNVVENDGGLPSLVIPVLNADSVTSRLLPIGTEQKSGKRSGKFLGLVTGASGNNLQLGLSFIVPFLNIPFGGGAAGGSSFFGSSNYGSNNYGSNNYGSNYATTPGYGTSSSTSLGINSGSIIFAIIIGLAAIILIPLFIYSFTGVSTSPFGRSDDIQDMMTNLAYKVDDALQQYSIDAPACLQRAICTQVKSSYKRMNDGTAGSIEKIVDGLTTNHYLNSWLDTTPTIQQAITTAKKPDETPCRAYFARCPYNIDSIYHALSLYAQQYGQQMNDNIINNTN